MAYEFKAMLTFSPEVLMGSMMMANVFGHDPNNNNPSFNLKAPRDNGTVVQGLVTICICTIHLREMMMQIKMALAIIAIRPNCWS